MTNGSTLTRTLEDHDERTGTLQPLLLTIPEAAVLLSIGRTTVYELIGSGAIATVHIGRSTRIPVAELRDFVARQQTAR
jgi:excisionase family DNA binding protein